MRLAALAISSCVFATGCMSSLPVAIIASVMVRRAATQTPIATLDSLRAGDSLRVWLVRNPPSRFVLVGFDSLRASVLFVAHAPAGQADTISLSGVTRLEVMRGRRRSATRAFWGPIAGEMIGTTAGVLAMCTLPSSGNLCGLAAEFFVGVPGTIVGAWWGLRPVPRWVTVAPIS